MLNSLSLSLIFLDAHILRTNFRICFNFIFVSRCKRLNRLGLHRLVLSKAGAKVFAVKAKNWSEFAHRFLKYCVNAGNVDACYTLGMVDI